MNISKIFSYFSSNSGQPNNPYQSINDSNHSFSNDIVSEVNLSNDNETHQNVVTSQLNIVTVSTIDSVDEKKQNIQCAINENRYEDAAEGLIALHEEIDNDEAKMIVDNLKSSTVSYLLGWAMSKIDGGDAVIQDIMSDRVIDRIEIRQTLGDGIVDEVDWYEKHGVLVGDVAFYKWVVEALNQIEPLSGKTLRDAGNLVLIPDTITVNGQSEPLTFKRYAALVDKYYKDNGWGDVIHGGIDKLNNESEWVNRPEKAKWLVFLRGDDMIIEGSCGKDTTGQQSDLKKINQEQARKGLWILEDVGPLCTMIGMISQVQQGSSNQPVDISKILNGTEWENSDIGVMGGGMM